MAVFYGNSLDVLKAGYQVGERNDEIISVLPLKDKSLSEDEKVKVIQEIQEHCRKLLPAQHVPKEIIVVDQLLKTASDKISRNDIIQILEEKFK